MIVSLTPSKLRVTSASPGKVHFELPIEKHHTNRLGILHGGTVASMVDTGGSLVLASRGLFSTGVTTDLSVTYLGSGGKVGDVIRGEAICDRCKALLQRLFLDPGLLTVTSRQDHSIYSSQILQQRQRDSR